MSYFVHNQKIQFYCRRGKKPDNFLKMYSNRSINH